MTEISKSKTTIESLIDEFYSNEKKQVADAIYNSTRSDVQDLIHSFVKQPEKRGKILDSYEKLKLVWMKKLNKTVYREKFGWQILDENKLSPTDNALGDLDIFTDPSLSFFKEPGSSYRPKITIGVLTFNPQLNIVPLFIHLLDSNPFIFLSMIAHEMSHPIGPQVSQIHGYDLKPEYRDLLSCYRGRKSIKLRTNQSDEVIADYISSEVLARQINQLPLEKRKQAMLSAMEHILYF